MGALRVLKRDDNIFVALKRMYLVQSSPCSTLEAACTRARTLIDSCEPENLMVRVQTLPASLSAPVVRSLHGFTLSRAQFTHVLSVVSVDADYLVGISFQDALTTSQDE